MEANNQIIITDVTYITREFCDLVDGCEHEVIYKDVELLDGDTPNNYTTILCCKANEVEKVSDEIDSFNGKKKEDYKLDNKYCHIATFENNCRFFYNISFDDEEDCIIHANYNDEYKYLDDFFKSFIRFRNNLIENNEVVKDDDIHQYFFVVADGIKRKNKVKFMDKVKQKIKRKK